MIAEFVTAWDAHKDKLRERLTKEHPEDYKDLVTAVIQTLALGEYGYGDSPDPEMLTEITSGGYQGMLVYVIGAHKYDSTFWYVRVSYGSCSGCDTLQSIKSWDNAPPTEEQTNDYMTLALHIVQGLKLMDGDVA